METNMLLEAWFADNVANDVEDNMTIGEMATAECLQKLNMGINPKTAIAFYAIVYEQIIEKLKQKREEKDEFAINIANVVTIGYDNASDDEESETTGNFNVFIQDGTKKPVFAEDPDLYTQERCTQWLAVNVTEQPKTIEAIAVAAVKALHETVEVELSAPECVFPAWAIIHLAMVSFLKTKRTEKSSYDEMIEFAGQFEAHCVLKEDGEVMMEYKPHVADKLNIKSNIIATASDE